MGYERRSRTWLSWLTVVVLGIVLVSGFVLAGGLGTGQGNVALARPGVAVGTSDSSTTTSSIVSGPTTSSGSVSGLNTEDCAGPSLAGSLILNGTPSGQVTLGLFGLLQHKMPLARRFFDTGQRVHVTFGGTSSAPFRFVSVPGGAVDYFVAILLDSGPITAAGQLLESAVVPVCGTRKATVTTTETATVTSTSTGTSTVILTDTITVTAVQTTTECGLANRNGVGSSRSRDFICCPSVRHVMTSAKTIGSHDSAPLSPDASAKTRNAKIRTSNC